MLRLYQYINVLILNHIIIDYIAPILNMKQNIKQLLEERLVSKMTKLFIAIFTLYILIGVWKGKELPPQIPLFYSLPRSSDQLSSPLLLSLLPSLSLAFFGIDFILASLLYPREKLASILLVSAGTVVSFLLLISFIKIIFLIT